MNVSAVGNNPNEEALFLLPQGQTRRNFAKRVVEVVIDIFWMALLSLGLALLSFTFVNDDTCDRKMGFGGRSFLWILVSAKIMPWSDYFWISTKVTVYVKCVNLRFQSISWQQTANVFVL